jgi:DNA-binding CsgD family transcriptional regulator
LTGLVERRGKPRPLTERQLEALRWLAGGRTNKEIGRKMNISEGTAKAHIRAILLKLDARNRTHAVAIGMAREPAREPQ